MVFNQALLSFMVGNPTLIIRNSLVKILPSTSIDLGVETFGVCIILFQDFYAGVLSFPSPVKNRQANDPSR
jgi:hypothetical protein